MDTQKRKDFTDKVKITTAIITVTVLVILLVIYAVKVLLLVFAAVMMAIFFRSIARFISQKTGMATKFSLPISVLGVLAIWIGLILLLQPKVSEQVQHMRKDLPKAASKVEQQMKKSKVGRMVLNQIPSDLKQIGSGSGDGSSGANGNNSSDNAQAGSSGEGNQGSDADGQGSSAGKGSGSGNQGSAKGSGGKGFIAKFFSTTFGVLGDLYVIFLLSMFFMANPRPYKRGIILLLPKKRRKRTEEVLDATGITLRLWLFGKLISMGVVTLLTFIGLWILGVPLFITLAIIAGLLSFIPNFGPLLAIIPAFLVGFTQSPSMGLWVVLLYVLVQAIESNLITPFIMKRQIQVPMAMTLISQVLLSILVGGLGLIFATPIIAMFMVFIQMLYIEDILGDRSIDVKGEEMAKSGDS